MDPITLALAKNYTDIKNRQHTVQQYGAVGDGMTDDTVALQNALNALSQDETLVISDGIFETRQLSLINKNRVTLQGNGVIRFIAGGGSASLVINNCADLQVREIIFDGNANPNCQFLIDIQNSPNAIIEGCHFRNLNNGTLDRVICLFVAPGCHNIRILNNFFSNIRGLAVASAIRFDNDREVTNFSKNGIISHNHIESVLPAVAGNAITLSQDKCFSDIIISHNTIHNSAGTAIHVTDYNTIIFGNHIIHDLTTEGTSGITIGGRLCTVASNKIKITNTNGYHTGVIIAGESINAHNNFINFSSTTTGTTSRGFAVQQYDLDPNAPPPLIPASNNTIAENTVQNAQHGIVIFNPATTLHIFENRFHVLTGNVLHADSTVVGTQITNNFARNISGNFIQFNATIANYNNITIVGNLIRDMTGTFTNFELVAKPPRYNVSDNIVNNVVHDEYIASILRRRASAAPTTGAWAVGDLVMHTAPAAGGNIGWVCVTAGTPGTWRTWGTISTS